MNLDFGRHFGWILYTLEDENPISSLYVCAYGDSVPCNKNIIYDSMLHLEGNFLPHNIETWLCK